MHTPVETIVSIFILLVIYFRFTRVNRKIIQRYKSSKMQRQRHLLHANRDFGQIAAQYRQKARKARKPYERDHLEGLAALYDHDGTSAIPLLKRALDGATGHDVKVIRNNLAIAFLQKAWYPAALETLEEARRSDYVMITAYVIALLIHGKVEQAENFYRNHALRGDEKPGIDKLMRAVTANPPNIAAIREAADDPYLWLYRPAILAVAERMGLLDFFAKPDRYELLHAQGKQVLAQLDGDPQLFASPQAKYVRSLIAYVVPFTAQHALCASLFGLPTGVESLIEALPVASEVRAECLLFWGRVHYVFGQTRSIETFDPHVNGQLVKLSTPPDAVEVISGSRCALYLSESLDRGIRMERIDTNYFTYTYIDLMPLELARRLCEDAQPVQSLLREVPSAENVLEPLLFRLICYPESVTPGHIQDAIAQLPEGHRDRLAPLTARTR